MRSKHLLFTATLMLLPAVSCAQVTAQSLLAGITSVVVGVIPMLISIAVLVFFWGLVRFINSANDPTAVEEGKQLMIWGMMAIFVMVALWGIIGFLQGELGLDNAGPLGTLPSQPDAIP